MRFPKEMRIVAAGALGALLSANIAQAAGSVGAIESRLRALEAEISKLRKEAREAKAQAQAATGAAHKATNVVNAATGKFDPAAPPPPPPVFVSFKNGIFIETEDKAYSFKVGGRILVDGGASSSPERGYGGLVNFSQAWLIIEGRAAKIWEYKLAYDFANTSAVGPIGGLRDAYVALKHPAMTLPVLNSPVSLIVGNQWEPNGLDTINAFTYVDFLQRSLMADTLGGGRHLGAAAATYGSNWSAKAGIFSTSVQDNALAPSAGVPVPYGVNPKAGWVATGGSQYFDVAARGTYAPILAPDRLLHLGASGRYHQPNNSTGVNDNRNMLLGSASSMDSNILRTNLLGTPDLSCGAVSFGGNPVVAGKCVRDAFFWGAELVGSYGPLSVQAEYMGAHYDRRGGNIALASAAGAYAPGGTSQNFNGYYVYGTWYLTGESRAASYSLSSPNNPATFGQIKILKPVSAGGIGAWELAARLRLGQSEQRALSRNDFRQSPRPRAERRHPQLCCQFQHQWRAGAGRDPRDELVSRYWRAVHGQLDARRHAGRALGSRLPERRPSQHLHPAVASRLVSEIQTPRVESLRGVRP